MRRTWAPKGRTPVLRHPYRRGKQISMCGLLAYRHSDGDGEQVAAWMGFELLEGAYDARQFVRVLDGLGHQLGHQPVTVIWDNLGAHHAGDLRAWAATQPWLVVEYLPSYAPELDPVEGLWANLKGCELANRCCADRRELIATAQVGSIRVRRDRICCGASWPGRASRYESPTTAKICSNRRDDGTLSRRGRARFRTYGYGVVRPPGTPHR